jgi:hypothetical protein
MYRLAFLSRINRFGRLAPRPIHYAPGFPERLWLNFLARSIASRDHCRVDTTFEARGKKGCVFSVWWRNNKKKGIERRYWQHGGVVAIETRDMLLQIGAL